MPSLFSQFATASSGALPLSASPPDAARMPSFDLDDDQARDAQLAAAQAASRPGSKSDVADGAGVPSAEPTGTAAQLAAQAKQREDERALELRRELALCVAALLLGGALGFAAERARMKVGEPGARRRSGSRSRG